MSAACIESTDGSDRKFSFVARRARSHTGVKPLSTNTSNQSANAMSALPSQVTSDTPERDALGIVDRDTIAALSALVKPLSREQLVWTSGYLAGLAAANGAPAAELPAVPAAAQDAAPAWHVFYATETGNSRRAAEALAEQLRNAGAAAELVDLRDFDPKALRRMRRAAFVVATHGLGDPPEGTEAFFDYWHGERAPRLEQLEFAVLALGDSTYEQFCGVGRHWDARLEALGAARVQPRVDCDVDFDAPAEAWRTALAAAVAAPVRHERATVATIHPERLTRPQVSRDAPFHAPVLASQRITGRGSSKDVRHVELSLEGAGLRYEPGDSIGVWPSHSPEQVAAVLEAAGLNGNAQVQVGGSSCTLEEALRNKLEITQLGRGVVEAYAALTGSDALRRLLAAPDELRAYLATRQVVDLVAEHPASLEPQAFAGTLRKLTPRLYSAASSLTAHPDEVHLTVSVVAYERFGRAHSGAASPFLARAAAAPIYVERNEHFRLPRDGAVPIVMIGAGTGVAPFRAFVQHRREHGATGASWLFYGDRTLRDDFLYQVEWLKHRESGGLRLDAAFSRDQGEKVYVQHRIAERAADLYDWLERGAHVYVCGDAEGMAPAVHAALRDAVQHASGRTREAAEEYLQALKSAKRYQRDVY
jgi:sulfite reductase (NADPH) flavoprotein alpha-component